MKIHLITLLAIAITTTVNAQENDHYKTAANLFDNKQFDKALKEINLGLKKDSADIDLLMLKGSTLKALKKRSEAVNVYTRMIDLYPEDYKGYMYRAILLNNMLRPEDALADYNEALSFEKLDSNRMLLYINRATAHTTMRQFEEAYEDCMRAYQIDSLDLNVLTNLATVCDEVGKGELTLKYLHKVLELDSTFISAWGNIGFKYQQMGDYNKAITYFNKVQELDPSDPLAYSNRSYCEYKLGDLTTALKDINQSLKMYPGNSYAYRIRALIYLAMDKKQKACADLTTAIDKGFTKMYGDEVKELQKKNCR